MLDPALRPPSQLSGGSGEHSSLGFDFQAQAAGEEMPVNMALG